MAAPRAQRQPRTPSSTTTLLTTDTTPPVAPFLPQSHEETDAIQEDAKEALKAGAQDEAAHLLVLAGYPMGMVARLCGYPSHIEAARAVRRLLKRQEEWSRKERQRMELQRLERLERRLQPQIEQGNVEAIRTAVLLGQERRKIMGDDEPARVAPLQMPSQQEIERFAAGIAGALGQDAQTLATRFKATLQTHGYLPSGAEGEESEVVDAESVEIEAEPSSGEV